MKKLNWKWKFLLIIICPLFMYNVCGRHDLPDLPDLPNTDEYFTWRVPGYDGNITGPPDSIVYNYYSGNKNEIISYTLTGTPNGYITFYAPQSTGTYGAVYFNVFNNGKYFVSASVPIQVNITSFGGVGQDIIGSYSGPVKDSLGFSTYTIRGNFKVKNK